MSRSGPSARVYDLARYADPRARQWSVPARGTRYSGSDLVTVCVQLSEETHEHLRAYALAWGVSFTEAARRVIAVGLVNTPRLPRRRAQRRD